MKLSLLPQYPVLFRKHLRRKLANHKVPCPLCGCRESALICITPNVHMAIFRHIFVEKVVACRSCGFAWTNPRPDPEVLAKYYTEDYLLEGLSVPKSVEEFLGEDYKEIWFSKDRDLRLILEQKQGGRLLDIGCASGTLLWLAREQGFSVCGVDVGQRSAEFVRGLLGMEVFCGQLESAHFPERSFDAVSMIHALEHVPDPRPVVREIHRILRDDCVFVGVVPNFAGWSSQKFGPSWDWLQPHNHYSHFTPDSLRSLMKREGFDVEIRSEEGRYGDAEILKDFGPIEIQNIFSQLKGSELVFVARKTDAGSTVNLAGS